MSPSNLLRLCVRFTMANSWPLLALAALFVPVIFGLDYSSRELFSLFNLEDNPWLYFPLIAPYVPVFALVSTFYYSLLMYLGWAILHKNPVSYRSFHDWLRLSFWNYFLFSLIYYMVVMGGLVFAILPVFIYMIILPYLEIVILFEQKNLRESFSRSIELLLAMPGPAVIVGVIRFAVIISLPYTLMVLDLDSRITGITQYVTVILEVPFYIAYLVLFSILIKEHLPETFKSAEDEKEL